MTQKEIINLIEYYQSEINQLEFRKKNMKQAIRRLQSMLDQLDETYTDPRSSMSFAKAQRPPVIPDSPWDDLDSDDDVNDTPGDNG